MTRVLHPENLIPYNKRSKEEVKALQSKGGKNSVKSRRLFKTFKEVAKYALDKKANKQAVDILSARFPDIPREEIDNRMAIFLAQLAKAMGGDSAAYDRVQQTAGEREPETNVVIQQTDPVDIKKSLKDVKDFLKDI